MINYRRAIIFKDILKNPKLNPMKRQLERST